MDYQEAQAILKKQKDAQAVLEQYKKIETAHEDYGFKNRKAFIRALQEIGGKGGKRSAKAGGRKRLSPAARKELEEAIKAGKSGPEIASQFGISQPYVYALKSKMKGAGALKAVSGKAPGAKKTSRRKKKK